MKKKHSGLSNIPVLYRSNLYLGNFENWAQNHSPMKYYVQKVYSQRLGHRFSAFYPDREKVEVQLVEETAF